MVLISSKTLIQAHAVFLVVIAGYLVKSPEVITDCDLVFMMGEALKIVRPISPIHKFISTILAMDLPRSI